MYLLFNIGSFIIFYYNILLKIISLFITYLLLLFFINIITRLLLTHYCSTFQINFSFINMLFSQIFKLTK